jgi:DNA polymerase-3 subunit epsilon
MDYDQTHWAPRQRRGPLPTFYYHDHFLEVLDFVERHYAHTLLAEHVDFIRNFRSLPKEAQCLYVRLVNRKGRLFARNRLRYPELGPLSGVLEHLHGDGWVSAASEADFDDILEFLTRAEIYSALLPRMAGLSRSLKKPQLLELVRTHVAPRDLLAGLDLQRILVQRRVDHVRYLLFLYFGEVRDGLSRFTMRDLGIVQTQTLADTYEPRFSDRDEALEHYYFAHRLKRSQKPGDAEFSALTSEASSWPDANFPGSATLRDELAYKLGRTAERKRDAETALALYRSGESANCSERIVRLLLNNGRRDEAREYLERCLESPRSDEEWHFACDIFERKFNKKRTSTLTDMLRSADSVDIDESKSGAPERAVVEHFEQHGVAAYRSENQLWRTFFGLFFWDLLFADEDAKTHSPFEFLPAVLANGQFWEIQKTAIEQRLDLITDRSRTKNEILKTSTRFYGTPNGVFRWRRSMNDAIFALIDHGPAEAIKDTLLRFCKDYANARYGYPDLMIVDETGVRFVEVKTEGDQLRRNQLMRLEQLKQAGFRADVLRVRWVLDPNQAYVVVDVETTGGRGENHRVTEIGAVKVKGDQIVDRFQTLLNPQRSIPPNITRLTGISPAMVEQAPCFTDIADDFYTFLEGAIFVAHNVDFDYRFIAAEFGRIGKSFRMPKLCTCSSMRRLYPGQRSYSLDSLCRSYGIPLKQHHRALCDAEAATELLFMINDKRRAQSI